ncbi:MAG: dynamin family protein [Desulfobacterales bacterium]|nr:dynamin family protein [Desulfobacterales bacterium]
MDQANKLLKDLSKKASSLYQIIQKIKKNPDFYDEACKKWEETCKQIPDQINKDSIKIAVTGTIKSGKSTFVNSIFKADFLKRGAGVLTSIVTKIQRQDELRAKLLIKSWDEINQEIEEALLSFDDHYSNENIHFDLRREKDRKLLKKIYEKLLTKRSFEDNKRRPEIILFNNALKNYKFCKDIVKPDETLLELKNDKFNEHMVFTGDPSKAFFIKDAFLEINFGNIDKDIEIADCQGIDSTDTVQLSKVLEYLESCNIIIYLISSRTGLREADMRFLSIINKMGIGDNVVFVVNCDLGEHESLNDLISVEHKIEQDLLFFKQDLNFYSFSSLYNLFNQIGPQLSVKDKKRLKAWESDKEIIKYSDGETEKFFCDFDNWINKDRFRLIFANPNQRLTIVAKGLQKKVKIFSDILSDDGNIATKALQELKEIQSGVSKIKALVINSMQSIDQDFKKENNKQVDSFFKQGNNSIIDNIIFFINNYVIGLKLFEEQILTLGFPKALYFVFQDFKKEFDYFLVEKVNPELVKFVKDQDKEIENHAVFLYNTYKMDLFNLSNKLSKMSHALFDTSADIHKLTDLHALKKRLDIKPPSAVFLTQYNARIKISSFTGFGLYSLLLILIKKLKKESNIVMTSVLKKAYLRFKKEALRSIKLQIEEYKQKVKVEYFDFLIKALSQEIKEIIIDQFQIYSVEINKIESIINKEKSEKDKQKESLLLITKDIEEVLQKP